MFSRSHILQISSVLLFVLVVVACQHKRPSDILPPDKMEAFLYDFHVAKALGDDAEYSERYKRSVYVDYVYNKHHISKEEFDHSMSWYTRNLSELVKIYDKINLRLGEDKGEIDQLVAWQYDTPMVSISGDSVDVWAWHQIYRLTGTPLNNTISFTLPVDSNFYDGDKLEWNVRVNYQDSVELDSLTTAVMQLAMHFTNDSLLVRTEAIQTSGMKSLALQSDSLWTLKNVKGFIYYPPQRVQKRLLIDSVSLYRFHLPKDTVPADSIFVEQAELEVDSLTNAVDSLAIHPESELSN